MRPTRGRLRLAGLLLTVVLALLLSACGGGDETAEDTAGDGAAETDAPTPMEPTPAGDDTGDGEAAAGPVTLEVASSDVGEHLVDGEGNTLYLFTNDTQGSGESSCSGGCQENWPPLTSDGEVTAGEGIDTELVSTITRADGSEQVAYNGWPLYYFAGDEAPGDTNGQGSGGVWFVVDAAGEAIEGS